MNNIINELMVCEMKMRITLRRKGKRKENHDEKERGKERGKIYKKSTTKVSIICIQACRYVFEEMREREREERSKILSRITNLPVS